MDKPMNKADYEDLRNMSEETVLISTFPETEQLVLIKGTTTVENELSSVETALRTSCPIIVYGRNANDETICKKYRQLQRLGHKHVYVYFGGMWEWLLLQDVYGADEFETTSYGEPLSFRPESDLRKIRNG